MNNIKSKTTYIPFIDRLDIFIILIYLGLLCLAGILIAFSSYEIGINHGKAMTSIYVVFLIGCCCLLLSLYAIIKKYQKAIIFINEILINNKTIILKGLRYNTPWEKRLTIKNIDISLKEQTNRRPYIYYLEFLDEDDTKYNINTAFYWNYSEILATYTDIKNAKNKSL
jgi:hypothetical protein